MKPAPTQSRKRSIDLQRSPRDVSPRLALAGFLVANAVAAAAGPADVLEAHALCSAESLCVFTVSVKHADSGWQHYANRWEVLGPNDEVLAETKGINLTLTPFDCPKNTKVIEMFTDFTLDMLREEIKKELGIPVKAQKALIRSGWSIIDQGTECRDIAEYETITVLTDCECSHSAPSMPCRHGMGTGMGMEPPPIRPPVFASHSWIPFIPRLASRSYKTRTQRPCKYGEQCRYNNHPQIAGPCRFYHHKTTKTRSRPSTRFSRKSK